MFEHLHERDIIYRDLKPENVMIDEEGYPKLIDFGIAKIVQGRTYTVVGTPHYMAPEVIVGKGYSLAADYWSIGIMIYEFACGGVPFGEEEEDPYIIYEKVIERKLVYPSFVDIRMPSKPVIEQLLSKNPAMRTGGSINNLKSHPWFHGFNWDALINRQMPTPYKPRLPDLTREIQSAMKNSRDINEIITKEESTDEPPSSKNRRANIPESWDQEF
jgi:cGMP-dependent protein kinase